MIKWCENKGKTILLPPDSCIEVLECMASYFEDNRKTRYNLKEGDYVVITKSKILNVGDVLEVEYASDYRVGVRNPKSGVLIGMLTSNTDHHRFRLATNEEIDKLTGTLVPNNE